VKDVEGAKQGWVSGFVKTVRAEHAELGLKHVDLAGGSEEKDSVAAVLAALARGDVVLPHEDVEVAIRENRSFVPRLVACRANLSESKKIPVKEDASYVITGGLGALGLVFAKRLAADGARSLVLLSRRGSDAEAEKQLAPVRAAGCRVTLMKCDVSDPGSVRSMLKELNGKGSLPQVRGIIHSAGVLDDATVENQTLDRFKRVFPSKVSEL